MLFELDFDMCVHLHLTFFLSLEPTQHTNTNTNEERTAGMLLNIFQPEASSRARMPRGSDEPSALASGLVGGMSYVFFVSPDELDGGLTPPGDV